MPRPRKDRKVCHFPQTLSFTPADAAEERPPVILTIDEYETIRLIDQEGLSQEECGEFMQVARTTVQQVYGSARKKLAQTIVDGRPLRIEGGNYRLCSGEATACGRQNCFKHHYHTQYEKPKGETIMRIAVTYDNGAIFQHFGHTEQFKVYDVAEGKVIAAQIVDTNGQGHGALANFLFNGGVDVLICGGIGGGAINALANAGIDLYPGIDGSADMAVMQLLAGVLPKRTDVRCSHHDHEHGEGHDCGSHEHSCGSHSCGSHGCH